MGSATINPPVNVEQFHALFPQGFATSSVKNGQPVTVHVDGLTDQQVASALATVVYDAGFVVPTVANRQSIIDGLTTGLGQMQQIIDADQVTFSNLSQAQTACRDIQAAIKAEARQLRRLTRLALGLLDGSE